MDASSTAALVYLTMRETFQRKTRNGDDHAARVRADRAGERDGRTPVVFIHGLWLLPSSWDRWAAAFEEAGYAPLAPGWPDDPETVEQARANPEVLAGKGVVQVADHFAEVIGKLDQEAGDHRPLLRRPDRAGPRRPRALGRHRRGRPRALQRGAAAADRGDPHDVAGARQPGQPRPRRHPQLRAVPLRLGQRHRRGRGAANLRASSTSPRRAGRSSRRRSPTSTPPPRPRPTPRTPSAGRC